MQWQVSSPDRSGGTIRIVTYNFLAGGSRRRCTHWTMLRERLAPDILLTQECRPRPADGAAEPGLWTEAKRGHWGTGLFTTSAIRPIRVIGFKGWVTGGELVDSNVTGRSVRVFSIHCPAGDRGYVRTMHVILDRLKRIANDSDLVLGGDFNVATGYRGPDEPVKMSRAEKDLLDRIATEFDLIPCWQTANPNRPLAQTLRWTGNRAAPYHCDGIFVPRSWRDRLQSCEVVSGPEWDELSDHNPVVAVFDSDKQ